MKRAPEHDVRAGVRGFGMFGTLAAIMRGGDTEHDA